MRTFQKMGVLILVLVAGINSALGVEDAKHVEAFRNYNTALESGDAEAVDRHAKEAWLAAEEELGDHQTTAILAYNYAHWIYEHKPQEAIKPLGRVIALIGVDNEMFGADLPIIMLRYCEVLIAEDKKLAFKELLVLLERKEKQGLPSSRAAGLAWLLVATNQMKRVELGTAKEYGGYAERHLMEAAPNLKRKISEALILQGAALVSSRKRKSKDLQNSIIYFDRAIVLFSPQENIASFDPLLAIAIAWRYSVISIAITDKEFSNDRGAHKVLRHIEDNEKPDVFWASGSKWGDCEIEWEQRKSPKYPKNDLDRDLRGAVLLGYNLSEEGHVIDARVLAEVPGRSEFGAASLKAAEAWQTQAPPPTECRENLLSTFNYVIGY